MDVQYVNLKAQQHCEVKLLMYAWDNIGEA
jgi:hypothetical protein